MHTYDELVNYCEEGELFVKCVNTVSDGMGTYCVAGKTYEVIDVYYNENNKLVLDVELDMDLEDEAYSTDIVILFDDPDFEIVIK